MISPAGQSLHSRDRLSDLWESGVCDAGFDSVCVQTVPAQRAGAAGVSVGRRAGVCGLRLVRRRSGDGDGERELRGARLSHLALLLLAERR